MPAGEPRSAPSRAPSGFGKRSVEPQGRKSRPGNGASWDRGCPARREPKAHPPGNGRTADRPERQFRHTSAKEPSRDEKSPSGDFRTAPARRSGCPRIREEFPLGSTGVPLATSRRLVLPEPPAPSAGPADPRRGGRVRADGSRQTGLPTDIRSPRYLTRTGSRRMGLPINPRSPWRLARAGWGG